MTSAGADPTPDRDAPRTARRLRALAGGAAARVAALAILAAAALGVGTAQAGAVAYEPADGRVLSGVAVEYPPKANLPAFLAQTGQPGVALVHGYVGHLGNVRAALRALGEVDAATMISWRPMAASPDAPGGDLTKVAQGDIDAYLVKSAAQVRAHPYPVFIRPYWEFTGQWFPWSTYDRSGAQRPGNSPEKYRQAWQRIRIIFDGGSRADVNRRLAAVGLPPLTTGDAQLPRAEAAWVWSVSKGGVKPKDKPHTTADYYPGDEYVDWVGQGAHQRNDTPFSHWAAGVSSPDPLATMNAVYDFAVAHGKPVLITEWAIATRPYANGDDAKYVEDLLSWIEARPKVKGQVYFDRRLAGYTHQIAEFPKALAVFSRYVNGPRYIHDWRAIAGSVPLGPAARTDKTAPATSACATVAERPVRRFRSRLDERTLIEIQRNAQDALRRVAAINRRLRSGLRARDLCGASFTAAELAPGVSVANGAAVATQPASPARLRIGKRPTGFRPSGKRLTARQLLINQRVAQAAIRRLNALDARLDGSLGGQDLAKGALTQGKLVPGLRVTGTSGADPAAVPPPKVVKGKGKGKRVTLTLAQVRINERISAAALRRANRLVARMERGLTGASFRDGSIGPRAIA
jgi:hypothetical protein